MAGIFLSEEEYNFFELLRQSRKGSDRTRKNGLSASGIAFTKSCEDA